jgi:hypothetical protein
MAIDRKYPESEDRGSPVIDNPKTEPLDDDRKRPETDDSKTLEAPGDAGAGARNEPV